MFDFIKKKISPTNSASSQQQADTTSHRSVVVVDDDNNTLDLIRLNLEGAGLKVHAARDGASGLEMIRKHLPNAVVLDIKIPKINGYEICTTMQSDEKLRQIPIMIITGLVEGTPSEEANWREKMNVADFMSKPFPPFEFTERVLKIVQAA